MSGTAYLVHPSAEKKNRLFNLDSIFVIWPRPRFPFIPGKKAPSQYQQKEKETDNKH